LAAPQGIGIIDINRPIGDNLRELAKAVGKPVDEIRVAVLDRLRHADLVKQIHDAGHQAAARRRRRRRHQRSPPRLPH
jgi:fructose-1,6-bisphosphatase II